MEITLFVPGSWTLKFIITILAFLYICSSTGATLQMHYCMGKLADWGLTHSASKTCNKCGMKKGPHKYNNCCRDEHKFFKDKTDQQSIKAGFQMLHLYAGTLPIYPLFAQTHYFPAIAAENPMSHAPPFYPSVAVYIRNCVFLI